MKKWIAQFLSGIAIRVLLIIPAAAQAQDMLLANVYKGHEPLAEYRVSEKLDGVRAWWDGEALISRQGNRFAAPAWFVAGFPAESLDGELWMGRGTFEQVSGIVRRMDPGEHWRQVRYMVFDLPEHPGDFDTRLIALSAHVKAANVPWLQVVEHFQVPDHAALILLRDKLVAQGAEGLMLRRGDSLYRAGRSGDLLKVKPRDDADATVIAHLPGKGKYRGMLGALLVEMPNGQRFRLGTGFTDAQRDSPPPAGALVTYTHQGFTARGLPRFASFLRVRNDRLPALFEHPLPENAD